MERLTINQVIGHLRNKAKRIEMCYSRMLLEIRCIYIPTIRDYWISVQVVKWLEELKKYRESDDCGREYVKRTGKCPICTDCPHNCPLENNDLA